MDIDKLHREYNRYLRNRPPHDLTQLSDLILFPTTPPVGTFYKVSPPWDNPLPEFFNQLQGTLVTPHEGKLERLKFNRYFELTGTEPYKCPKGSKAVTSLINIKLPAKHICPQGYEYVGLSEANEFIYVLPETHLQKVLPYTLVLSRRKIKCDFQYRVDLATRNTVYLSVVQLDADAKRFNGVTIIPLRSKFELDFSEDIQEISSIWESNYIIPPLDSFVTPYGECLTFKPTRFEDASDD